MDASKVTALRISDDIYLRQFKTDDAESVLAALLFPSGSVLSSEAFNVSI